jgi:hypothetical protein
MNRVLAKAFRCLFITQSAEKPQLDNLTFTGIELGQLLQRLVNAHHFGAALIGNNQGIVQRHDSGSAAPLRITTIACVINQDSPHHLRRNAEKVRSVLPPYIPLIDESHESLIDQC